MNYYQILKKIQVSETKSRPCYFINYFLTNFHLFFLLQYQNWTCNNEIKPYKGSNCQLTVKFFLINLLLNLCLFASLLVFMLYYSYRISWHIPCFSKKRVMSWIEGILTSDCYWICLNYIWSISRFLVSSISYWY